MHVIEARTNFDILKERHSEHSKDEHDQEQKEADVDEGGEGHDEREEQCSNTLRALDQT